MTLSTPALSLPAADDDALWRGVLDRSEDLDGRSFYAVSSTGIYCRPSCPSPRPQRGNVRFYATPAAAERAGFRPCKRGHPRVHAEAAEGRLLAAELRVAAEIRQRLLPGRLESGATLLLYSDGVSEAASGRGDELGIAPLESLLAASHGRPAAAVGGRLEALLAEHTGGGAADDDRTWLVLRRAGEVSDAH
jgi:methylphosphotriester-DNA--protein-cysteine methyltransferase